MALTATDRFRHVRLGFNPLSQAVPELGYSTVAGDAVSFVFDNGEDLPSGHAHRAELDILQEIYASTDGFLDEDGNRITVTAFGFLAGGNAITDADDFESHGLWNPLIDGSYDRWVASRKAIGAFLLEEAQVTEDPTSGRHDLKMPGGLTTTRRRPSTSMMMLDMRDWSLAPDASQPERLAWMSYEAPIGADWAGSNGVGGLAPVRRMVQWLEDHRNTGDPVDLTPTSLADLAAGIGTREYRFISNGLYFDFVMDSHRILANETTLELRAAQTTGSSADLDLRELLTEMMSAPLAVIEVTRTAEYPPSNPSDAPLYGSSFRLPGNIILRERNKYPTLLAEDHANDWYEAPIGYGRVIALDSLSTFNGKQRMGAYYGVQAIHMDSSYDADETLILPNPSTFLQFWGVQNTLTLHNQNEDHNFVIEDADEVNVATLLPGQILNLRFSRDARGNGEITNASEFTRAFRYSATPDGDSAIGDQPYMVYGPDTYIRLVSLHDETPTLINVETFHLAGTDVFSEGDTWDDIGDYHFTDSVEVRHDGILRCDIEVGLRGTGGSGNIQADNGLAVFRQRDTLDPELLRFHQQTQFGGTGSRTMFTYVELPVEVGDVMLFGFLYDDDSTLDLANMQFSSVKVEMYLDRTIRVSE